MAIVQIKRETTDAGRKFRAAFENMAKQETRELVGVGWWGDQTHNLTGASLSSIAYLQEYGGITVDEEGEKAFIPPRPFLSPTYHSKRNEWAKKMASGIRDEIKSGEGDSIKAIKKVAEDAKSDIVQKIESIHNPPLAPLTIHLRKKRGNHSRKPLIDTGQFVKSVEARILK